jgi:O-antigen/teichoic acid export membrane protein
MGSSIAVNLLVMRSLGVDGFGVYGYVTTLVTLVSFGSGMGMDRLVKREIARDETVAGRYVASALAASALLSAVTAAGLLAWVWLVDGRGIVLASAALGALAMGLQSLSCVPVAYFHGIRRMRLGVGSALAGKAALVGATALCAWLRAGVAGVFAAQVLDTGLTLVLVWQLFRGMDTPPLVTAWREIRALIVDSVPFGLNTLFGNVYLGADVLLLARLRGDTEVGVYRAAVMLLTLFPLFAETFSTGIFPRMARHLGQADRAGAELRFTTRILLAMSVPVAIGGILTARPLLVLLGGPAFAPSAVPFVIMAPLLPLRFVNNGFGMTLSALDQQGSRTRGVFYAACLNIGANLLILPRWGANGAAFTTLVTELALSAWLAVRIRPLVTGLAMPDALVRVGLAGAGMAAGMLLLPPLPVLATIAIGAALYAACAIVSGALRPDDLHHLRSV